METENFAKDDSEYTCMTCSYQTNSDENLKRHKITAHEERVRIKCDRCKKDFTEKNDLRKHIITAHKNFKPCRNFAAEGNCRWNELCHFSHQPVKENMQRCYKCGTTGKMSIKKPVRMKP